jgi:hypothetical protein
MNSGCFLRSGRALAQVNAKNNLRIGVLWWQSGPTQNTKPNGTETTQVSNDSARQGVQTNRYWSVVMVKFFSTPTIRALTV